MQTLGPHLVRLYSEGVVTAAEAVGKASNPEEFRRLAKIGGGRQEAA